MRHVQSGSEQSSIVLNISSDPSHSKGGRDLGLTALALAPGDMISFSLSGVSLTDDIETEIGRSSSISDISSSSSTSSLLSEFIE
jgi:hypothetical protein